ncbi:MAG: SUF system NifU family Fe-S cluster assembly protein [Erysipelotrichales bacterium]|nr:SUF system NifU family Fe-S cluster assembly protein [Erysipelotrichales bacterium]
MSLKDDASMLRSIIMDHYEYPRNHSLTDDTTYASKHMASASCIDDIEVQAKIENDRIEDIRFDGTACTIATSSTSIMSELLRGKTTEEAKAIMDQYFGMIDGKDFDEDVLQEAVAFCNVGRQANRIKCATIGWRAMAHLMGIEEYQDEK